MERRSFLKKAAAGTAVGVAAAPTVASAAEMPTINWRLASSFPKNLDTIYGAAETLSNRVKELTDGKFNIRPYAAPEIVQFNAVMDAVKDGTVEMGHTASYYYYGKDATFAFDCAVPFGMTSRQQTAWMLHGNGMKLMREFFAEYNIVNFLGGNSGTQMGGWFRKEIKSVEDMKGLKFRVGGFAGKVLQKLGTVPVQLAGGEIYTSLEKGAIDAAEWIGPYDDEKLGFNKVAKFYHYPGWWEGGAQLSFYVSKKEWDKLPKLYQAAIETATFEAHVQMQAKYDARNPAALKQLYASKVNLVPMPKDVMDAAFKASQEIYSELNEKNPAWRKVYADYAKFLKDENLWFRFTEAKFDAYMQNAKL